MLKRLDGRNRILALLILLGAGAVQAFAGVDVIQHVDLIMAALGLDGSWLAGIGPGLTPAKVTFGSYCAFAVVNALLKERRATKAAAEYVTPPGPVGSGRP